MGARLGPRPPVGLWSGQEGAVVVAGLGRPAGTGRPRDSDVHH